jgi:rubrerythrin
MLSRVSLGGFSGKRRFADLSEREILALAISAEEEDRGIYAAYAAKLRADFPGSAAVFDGMAAEEDDHRRRLIDVYRRRFGDFVVPVRREHVADFFARRPVWLVENLGLDRIRQEVADMERQAEQFYSAAAARATDAETRKLLGDLARAEAGHEAAAERLTERYLGDAERAKEDLHAR